MVTFAERRRADVEAHAEAPSRSRRATALVALLAVLLFAAVAGALAWRQYDDAQESALDNARARAVLAATVFDTYFGGQIDTLTSIAQAPAVVAADEAAMFAYFERIQPPDGKLFTGGLAWANRAGVVRVSTGADAPGAVADVSDRSYHEQVLKTRKPFVSEGLTSRLSREQVVVTAVPTRDAAGKLAGVLIGTMRIRSSAPNQSSLDLGFAGLAIIDRANQSIDAGFLQPDRLRDPGRFAKAPGVLDDATGLDGESGHVLAYARALVPGWTVILDRPRSEVFAAARRTLVLEMALLGGVALLDLALLAWILVRSRAQARAERELAARRRKRYEQEHQVATTLQRSLLVDVPQIDAIDSAARYQAGSTGLEVGGDWFDVLRRPDGIVHATVGDVAGHGVAAAALMGQLRNAFRAYAYEHTSPSAIMTRLLRHIGRDEMATAICITIDPFARELSYASAGHPPPLLRDDDTGEIIHLDRAQSPVLAPVTRTVGLEQQVALPRHATLVAYTDGMVEQRDQVIDDGIGCLVDELRSAAAAVTADALADILIRDVAEVIAAADDVALLVMRFADIPAEIDMVLPPDPAALAETRRRLRLWMLARGIETERCEGVTHRDQRRGARGAGCRRSGRAAARHPPARRSRGRRGARLRVGDLSGRGPRVRRRGC